MHVFSAENVDWEHVHVDMLLIISLIFSQFPALYESMPEEAKQAAMKMMDMSKTMWNSEQPKLKKNGWTNKYKITGFTCYKWIM